jgi:hypothetical protein
LSAVGLERRLAVVDVAKVLKDAWKAVEDSGVPEGYRETAFNRAIDMLGGAPVGQPPIVSPPPPAPPGTPTPTPSTGASNPPHPPPHDGSDEDNFYAKLTTETEVPRQRLESVVHLVDGVPKVAINAKKLPSGKKPGQLFIARVILTARRLWLDESETAMAEVRTECERYGVLDGNFAKHMKNMDDPGLTQIGSGHGLKVKVRKNYISDFGDFLTKAIGPDESAATP